MSGEAYESGKITDLVVCYTGVRLVAYESANRDSETNAPIEDGPFPLQFRMFFKCPWLFVILSWDKTCTFELSPSRL